MSERQSVFRSKVAIKDLGDAKEIGTKRLKEEGRVLLGMIGGIADAVIQRKTDPKDETKVSFGLGGNFRAIPAEASKPAVNSGVCFLRDEIHGIIASQLKKQPDGMRAEGADSIRFLFNIYVIPANNPAGYSYEHENMMPKDEAAVDPLDALVFNATPALPAPTKKAAGKKK